MDFRNEQNRFHLFAKHLHPVGITHNMRPKSIERLFYNIGVESIKDATVLDIGCGQGFLVNHFLYAGAKKVVGTDITEQILTTIPLDAYNLHIANGKKVEFRLEDFEHEKKHLYGNYKIITLFIGILKLVQKLVQLFRDEPGIHVIAFMMPTRNFRETHTIIEQLCNIFQWTKFEFSIHLAGSGEQRRAMVLKKPIIPFVDLTLETPKPLYKSNGGKRVNKRSRKRKTRIANR